MYMSMSRKPCIELTLCLFHLIRRQRTGPHHGPAIGQHICAVVITRTLPIGRKHAAYFQLRATPSQPLVQRPGLRHWHAVRGGRVLEPAGAGLILHVLLISKPALFCSVTDQRIPMVKTTQHKHDATCMPLGDNSRRRTSIAIMASSRISYSPSGDAYIREPEIEKSSAEATTDRNHDKHEKLRLYAMSFK